MPVRGYYRVRTGKNSGVVISSGSGSGKGCGRALYWATIGWVIWLYKWLFIGLWKAGKWLFQTALILIHKLSVFIENRLSDRGHYWGLKKVKAGVVASLLVIFIGGCWVTNALGQAGSQQAALPSQTTTPTNTIAPITSTPVIPTEAPTKTNTAVIPVVMDPTITLPAAVGASCVPASSERQTAKVVGITDGDTIVVEIDGQEFPLRYIGVDSPETGSAGYAEATELNRSLVYEKKVTLVKDTSEVDRYDRLLRYVFVGDVFVNNEMVRAGYASSGSWLPDTACDSQFEKTYQTAKANMVGLWMPTKTAKPYVPPTPTLNTNKSGVVSGSEGGNSSASSCPNGCTEPPSGCLIKGNINSEGVKIYHVPGGGSYNVTKITPSKGERWFCTEAEAVANGWRKALN
jgi:micrococcal nuclease